MVWRSIEYQLAFKQNESHHRRRAALLVLAAALQCSSMFITDKTMEEGHSPPGDDLKRYRPEQINAFIENRRICQDNPRKNHHRKRFGRTGAQQKAGERAAKYSRTMIYPLTNASIRCRQRHICSTCRSAGHVLRWQVGRSYRDGKIIAEDRKEKRKSKFSAAKVEVPRQLPLPLRRRAGWAASDDNYDRMR